MRFYAWDDDSIYRITHSTIKRIAHMASTREIENMIAQSSRMRSEWNPRTFEWEKLPEGVGENVYGNLVPLSSNVTIVHIYKVPAVIGDWYEYLYGPL